MAERGGGLAERRGGGAGGGDYQLTSSQYPPVCLQGYTTMYPDIFFNIGIRTRNHTSLVLKPAGLFYHLQIVVK